MLDGETVATGAPVVCPECEERVPGPHVMTSAAGWYVGYGGCYCGPAYSRESDYYRTYAEAERALAEGTYGR